MASPRSRLFFTCNRANKGRAAKMPTKPLATTSANPHHVRSIRTPKKKKSLRVIFCFDWTRKKSMTRKYSKLSRMGFEVFTMWKHSMHSSYVAHKYSTSVGSGNNPWSHRSIFRLRWNRSTCPLIRIWGITTSHMQLYASGSNVSMYTYIYTFPY